LPVAVALLGGPAEPQRRGHSVLGHGAATQVVPREDALGIKVARSGGLTITPLGRGKMGSVQ
jgi:hypothetical protein